VQPIEGLMDPSAAAAATTAAPPPPLRRILGFFHSGFEDSFRTQDLKLKIENLKFKI